MSRKISNLRVPCCLLSVDSPKRREFLESGLPIQLHENILGHGSYGTVIKAIYKGKQVAVKVIDKLSPEKLATVANEANILGWVHKNIIQIIKIDSGPRQAVVIMERFPGQCLQHILESFKLPLYHIVSISIDIANGLLYCHERNLLHLDIKPKNILVAILNSQSEHEKSYQCKLCDFGSSTFIPERSQDFRARGTIRYMAPELLKDEEPTMKADIYSFGITMWQIRTGKDPFYWIADNETVAYKVVKENIRPDCKLSTKGKIYLSPQNTGSIRNCLCKHYGSDQSDSQIECTNPLTLTASHGKRENRTPFSNLNPNSNSLSPKSIRVSQGMKTNRLHQNYLFQRDTPVIKINSITTNEIQDLATLFYRKSTQNKARVICVYQNLYEKCWNAEPTARPDCLAVCNLLDDVLKVFNQQ